MTAILLLFDPQNGFARIYCDACGHDYLLAYSCKTRYFCPSCHQKRVLLYGERVEANVLAPVPHRRAIAARGVHPGAPRRAPEVDLVGAGQFVGCTPAAFSTRSQREISLRM